MKNNIDNFFTHSINLNEEQWIAIFSAVAAALTSKNYGQGVKFYEDILDEIDRIIKTIRKNQL